MTTVAEKDHSAYRHAVDTQHVKARSIGLLPAPG